MISEVFRALRNGEKSSFVEKYVRQEELVRSTAMIWNIHVDRHFRWRCTILKILLILLCGKAFDRQRAFEPHISPKYASTETSYQRSLWSICQGFIFRRPR